MRNVNNVWRCALDGLLTNGILASPRGIRTLERPQVSVVIDADRPVLMEPLRKLGYRFMAAEAYWILTGDDRVETIARYAKNIRDFSDDQMTFFGAYGPKFVDQVGYVVKKLNEDPLTRQAGINIWRENPPPSKDIPCTVAIFFQLRFRSLNAHVFMRSQDVWLGMPYDLFNFSMMVHFVCGQLNASQTRPYAEVYPGQVYLTVASLHLYEKDQRNAEACVRDRSHPPCRPAPIEYSRSTSKLITSLHELKDVANDDDPRRWWRY